MARVKIYSTGVCPLCKQAKQLLQKWAIPFDEVRVDIDQAALREFAQVTHGARTVPQIVIDGRMGDWQGEGASATARPNAPEPRSRSFYS